MLLKRDSYQEKVGIQILLYKKIFAQRFPLAKTENVNAEWSSILRTFQRARLLPKLLRKTFRSDVVPEIKYNHMVLIQVKIVDRKIVLRKTCQLLGSKLISNLT